MPSSTPSTKLRTSPLTTSSKSLEDGLTLIEILVVLGILAVIGSFSVIMGIDGYRRQIFRSDRDVLITALQHARSKAISNICLGSGCSNGKSHGVYIGTNTYVMFQGLCYASPCVRDPNDVSVDTVIEADPNVERSGISEIVFEQLSGDASTVGNIILTEDGHTSTITIGSEGQIIWTN